MKSLRVILVLLLSLFLFCCSSKTYRINFIDFYGDIVSSHLLEEGSLIDYPELDDVEGYDFISWDYNEVYAIEDVDISAVYEIKKFNVRFYDYFNELIDEQIVNYGSNAVAPNLSNYDYLEFVSWDKDFTNVKRNLEVKAIYKIANNDYEINDYRYWIINASIKYDVKEIILSEEEIQEYNNTILSNYNNTKVLDLCIEMNNISKTDLTNLIETYSNINKYSVYNNDTSNKLNSNNLNEILNNRNINGIKEENEVKYAIVTSFAWIRSYPTIAYSDSYKTDRFQETSVNVGEGLRVYHESVDGKWCFVQAQNYNGWILKEKIAFCEFSQMKDFLKEKDFALVISDYVMLEGELVRMGQRFPIINEALDKFIISFPMRDSSGNLFFKDIEVLKIDFNKGYLEYTLENVFKQAFKLLGINYSWGDKEEDGRDCSSTQNAVYSCFGFMMPRNTSNQRKIDNYGINVNGINGAYLKANYRPGSLIFSSGHVMMYIGEDLNGKSYILHNTSSNDGKCILQSLDSYGGNKIIAVLKLYN